MQRSVLNKEEFKDFVDQLIGQQRVVGVQEREKGKFVFEDLRSADDLRLDYDVTVLPPKKYIQPQKEALVKFNIKPKASAEAVIEAEPITIIGVHPYDMIAISQMDRLFAETNKDTNYLERRAHITIIGCDPMRVSKWSFWSWMGAGEVKTGFDIWLTDLGDKYFVRVDSEKGDKLAKKMKLLSPAKADIEKYKHITENLAKLCSERRVNVEAKDIPLVVKSSYESHVWEDKAKNCYSCGSCNLVCPTCYCFDVRDEMELNLMNGKRVRLWDGCLLEEFAKVGSGENFREERAERFRHRLFRKMVYVPEKLGTNELVCVGCGRCASVCLPDIADPVKIINDLSA